MGASPVTSGPYQPPRRRLSGQPSGEPAAWSIGGVIQDMLSDLPEEFADYYEDRSSPSPRRRFSIPQPVGDEAFAASDEDDLYDAPSVFEEADVDPEEFYAQSAGLRVSLAQPTGDTISLASDEEKLDSTSETPEEPAVHVELPRRSSAPTPRRRLSIPAPSGAANPPAGGDENLDTVHVEHPRRPSVPTPRRRLSIPEPAVDPSTPAGDDEKLNSTSETPGEPVFHAEDPHRSSPSPRRRTSIPQPTGDPSPPSGGEENVEPAADTDEATPAPQAAGRRASLAQPTEDSVVDSSGGADPGDYPDAGTYSTSVDEGPQEDATYSEFSDDPYISSADHSEQEDSDANGSDWTGEGR